MPEWEEWLAEVERFERRWSAQRDAAAGWLAAWDRWRSAPDPPRETALEYLAAGDELARGWEQLARDAASLAAGPGGRLPAQVATWRRHLRKRVKSARRERANLEKQRAEQMALAARLGISLGRVSATRVFRRLYQRSFRTRIIVIGGALVVLILAGVIWIGRSLGIGQSGAGLSWPCSLVAPSAVSNLVGSQVTVNDTIGCDFLWREPSGRDAELSFGLNGNGTPSGCRKVPGIPVAAVYCPPPDGGVYFTLGGYQWFCKEAVFGAQGTLPDPGAYTHEKAVAWLVAADYGPSPSPG